MRTRTPALLLCLLLGAGAGVASEAEKVYKRGLKAEREGHLARAYLLYSQAAAMEPGNQMFWLRSFAVRSRAASEAKVKPKTEIAAAPVEDPTDAMPDGASQGDLTEARKPLPPTELRAKPGRQDFDLRGEPKTLFEKVAGAFGLDTVFDGDYPPGKPFRFQMNHADYREALRALEAATGSFVVPLSPRVFLVVKDTPQKRNEVEPAAAVTVPVPEPTSTQDLAGIITAVQQTFALQKVGWDTQTHMVVLRGPVSKIVPARALFEELLYPKAQVDVELQFLEVTRNDMLRFGLNIPTSFPLLPLTTLPGSTIPEKIARFLLSGGTKTVIGVAIGNATLIAQMTESRGRVLLRTDIRSADGQAATFHAGDKYPIMTAGYFGPSSFQGPNTYAPPPSFQFEDLGLSMKVTPKVHGMDEVTLDLESEFKVLAGEGLNGIPILSSRQLKSTVRLKTGEWAVIGGLMQAQEARTVSGLAGASRIPVLSTLTGTRQRQKNSNYVVILLRPRLLSMPPDQMVTRAMWLGSENRPLSPL